MAGVRKPSVAQIAPDAERGDFEPEGAVGRLVLTPALRVAPATEEKDAAPAQEDAPLDLGSVAIKRHHDAFSDVPALRLKPEATTDTPATEAPHEHDRRDPGSDLAALDALVKEALGGKDNAGPAYGDAEDSIETAEADFDVDYTNANFWENDTPDSDADHADVQAVPDEPDAMPEPDHHQVTQQTETDAAAQSMAAEAGAMDDADRSADPLVEEPEARKSSFFERVPYLEDTPQEDEPQERDAGDAAASTVPLMAKIAALETAIGAIRQEWEPDGSGEDDFVMREAPTMAWEDDVELDATGRPVDFAEAAIEDAEPPMQEPQADAATAPLAVEDQLLDEEALRDLVSEIVRAELQGALGERITRNVRKLVRREIHRALTAQELE